MALARQTNKHKATLDYEAASAYLREERKKPKGEQDLLREMCVMVPLGLPKDRKVSFVIPSRKIIVALKVEQNILLIVNYLMLQTCCFTDFKAAQM